MTSREQWLDLSLDGLDAARADRVRAFRVLMVVGIRLRGLLDRALAPSGLTAQQGAMASWIEAQPAPPTISAVAAGLGMTHQNVKQIALALERKGLVDIQVDPDDRRARRLVLTEAHGEFWGRRNPHDLAAVQDWMAVWTEDEVSEALNLLLRLHHHLASQDPRASQGLHAWQD
ncbi:MAG: winged helix-turn-helix transcriptional regulator [Kineosporiaceae bacterium]|nr:winged helix-turn-helix transcriptional regulator [Kineosporiaceae bacterium]